MAETLQTSGRLSIAVAASRVLGLARDVMFGHLFGAGAIADAYQVAFRIPNLLRDLFAEGALSSAFVPTFAKVLFRRDAAESDATLEPDRAAAYHLGNLTLAGVLLVTGLLSLLGIVFAEQVIGLIANDFAGSQLGPEAAAEKLRLAVLMTRIMMPLLTIISVSAVWMGMLNAQKHYDAPAWAPAMFNVTSIVVGGGMLIVDPRDTVGVVVWSVATLGAGLVQAFYQLPALWRLGYRPIPRVRGLLSHPQIRQILRMMAPAVIGVAAVQINIFVNTRFAESLGDGPIAQLSYAFRVFYLPLGVFSVALATVTTTRVSEGVAKRDMAALTSAAGEGVTAVWMLMTASTVGLVVLAEPIVRVLWPGFLDAEATATAAVLQAYALALLPYGLVKILAPVFYGIEKPRIPLLGSFVAVAINIGFNAMTYQEYGTPGLALGTGIGALANILVLRLSFGRLVGDLPGVGPRNLLGLLVGNAVLGGLVWFAWFGVEFGVDEIGPDHPLWLRLIGLAVVVPLGFFAYVAVLRAFHYPGAAMLWGLPSKLVRKLRGR